MLKKLLLATTLLISSCVRTKTVEVRVPVPVQPDPCVIASPPDSHYPVVVLREDQGCPAGHMCLEIPSALATGLFIRDADRTFDEVRACPYVKIDETQYQALDHYLKTGTPLPTE